MKIGILTHPLISNYGGILQALAMKSVLEDLGHDVIILDRRHNLSFLAKTVKTFGKFIGIPRFVNPFRQYSLQKEFILKNFKRTKELHSHRALVNAIKKNKLDYVLIGSDQVWNLSYTKKSGLDYWGDFINDLPVHIISYAASMGVSDWSLDRASTEHIKKNLSKFNGISVRELQVKNLLEKTLDLNDIEWVVDPTMLHSSAFYDKHSAPRVMKDAYIFIYWLGNESLIPDLSHLYPNHEILKCKLGNPNDNLSVEEWLSAIKYAEAVVTDSFHGCAISIIYHKHFIPYINKSGGKERLLSLFTIAGLKDKINNPLAVENYQNTELLIKNPIQNSYNFLNRSISSVSEK